MKFSPVIQSLVITLGLSTLVGNASAKDEFLNLYSSRHYSTDEALYDNFTKQTGITVKRLELKDEALLERLRSEGKRSPADVVLLVDAARLWKAQQEDLFQPAKSSVLQKRIPARYQGDDGLWYGFSTRSRIIVYNKDSIDPAQVQNYEDLASPAMKGKVCTRSGAHPYMLSLMSSMISHLGEAKATIWAQGMVDNMARPPKGGDTDQIKGVASGECGVALTNSYYLARMMRSDKPADQEVIAKIGYVLPNQTHWGTHINVSGGAIAKYAPNRDAALKFLEYLATDEAQRYFADGNNEWPTVEGVKIDNPVSSELRARVEDVTPARVLAENTELSQKIMDRVGYK